MHPRTARSSPPRRSSPAPTPAIDPHPNPDNRHDTHGNPSQKECTPNLPAASSPRDPDCNLPLPPGIQQQRLYRALACS
jgi:hypothetical protein